MNFKKLLSMTLAAVIGIGVGLIASPAQADDVNSFEQFSIENAASTASENDLFSPLLPNWIVERINADLRFLNRLKFKNGTSSLSQRFFGSTINNGQDYVQFLKANIKRIEADGASVCGKNTAACATFDGVIHLSAEQAEWQNKKARIPRLAVLIHEATHIKTQVGHVICPVGREYENDFVVGTQACDEHIDQAYGLSYVFLNNIEKNCANCTKTDFKYIHIAKVTYRSMILGSTNELEE